MIFYLFRKYFAVMLVPAAALAVIPVTVARMPARIALSQAVFRSGLFAALVIYFEFKRRGLWPLYDNLGLPKNLLLTLFAVGNLIFYSALRFWMR